MEQPISADIRGNDVVDDDVPERADGLGLHVLLEGPRAVAQPQEQRHRHAVDRDVGDGDALQLPAVHQLQRDAAQAAPTAVDCVRFAGRRDHAVGDGDVLETAVGLRAQLDRVAVAAGDAVADGDAFRWPVERALERDPVVVGLEDALRHRGNPCSRRGQCRRCWRCRSSTRGCRAPSRARRPR